MRELRSSLGYMEGETRFLPLDMGSVEAGAFLFSEPAYDYVLNLAAVKHVRTEKDAYSLMRMIKVNVLDTLATFRVAPISIAYIVVMILLGFHLNHGVWSMFQSLGVSNPRYSAGLKRFAAIFSIVVVLVLRKSGTDHVFVKLARWRLSGGKPGLSLIFC